MFDPTVDRLLLIVGVLAIIIDGSVPLWFGWIVVIREVLLSAFVVTIMALGAERMDVTWFGKAGTFGMMVAFPAFLASNDTGLSDTWVTIFEVIAWGAAIPGLVFSFIAFFGYFPEGMRALRGPAACRPPQQRCRSDRRPHRGTTRGDSGSVQTSPNPAGMRSDPVKAVIMAGGEGTRLRPLTSNAPKPMLPLVNRPMMEHIIDLLKRHGIEDIVVTVAFMANNIRNYFGDGSEFGVRMVYASEETPLGTAGSVRNAMAELDDTFLVISGDVLTDIDLDAIIGTHRKAARRWPRSGW